MDKMHVSNCSYYVHVVTRANLESDVYFCGEFLK